MMYNEVWFADVFIKKDSLSVHGIRVYEALNTVVVSSITEV